MLTSSALLLLLAAGEPRDATVARAELERCAERIEAMKVRGERGMELDRLLRRAQDLAAELERTGTGEPATWAGADAPSPEELRERADAARDEADRLAAEIAALDVRLQDARRSRGELVGIEHAAMGASPVPAPDRVHALLAERATLSTRRARAEEAAARLDAEARAAERVR